MIVEIMMPTTGMIMKPIAAVVGVRRRDSSMMQQVPKGATTSPLNAASGQAAGGMPPVGSSRLARPTSRAAESAKAQGSSATTCSRGGQALVTRMVQAQASAAASSRA